MCATEFMKPTSEVCVLACNAVQFYETVSSTAAIQLMSDLMQWVQCIEKAPSTEPLACLRKKRRIVMGGVPKARCSRIWCFSFDELQRFFGIPMCVSCCNVLCYNVVM